MCEPIVPPRNISIEFEHDSALRATAVVIVNHDHEGNEKQATRVLCLDSGDIRGGVNLIEGVCVVGWAEMRG